MADAADSSPTLPPLSQEPLILEFHPDFNDETDDIILRSSDGVHFRVHSVTLRKASIVFGDMLSIPQPPKAPSEAVQNTSCHSVIDLQEPQKVVKTCLSLITSTPLPPETFNEFESLAEAVRFCDKYEMHGGLSVLRMLAHAPRFLEKHPVSLYKLACKCRWDELVDLAMVHCIEDSPTLPQIIETFQDSDIRTYTKLVALSQKRLAAFEAEISNIELFLPHYRKRAQKRIERTEICPDCVIDFRNSAWRAFRYCAIVQFQKRPGLTPFRNDALQEWDEVDALKSLTPAESGHNHTFDCVKLYPILEGIVGGLPRT